ncbi:sigma-70 family RNA polymerase sigma factor [Solibacillus sp. FSL W8-0474]|uniref:sigma-70 family RNA polymerase sigma factor n=1 Tax=Solibacillus sp. FSL W8-0474 TaxID=2975336 RepID=UPI0030F974A4
MKKIILSNDVKVMTFEEVLKQFTPMINRVASIFINKFVYDDKEEIEQELQIATWKAYQSYNGKYAFSTHLTYQLKSVTGNRAQILTAEKRTTRKVLSMNATLFDEESSTVENIIAQEDYINEKMVATEMMKVIMNNLNEREQLELNCLLYPKEFSSTKLSEKLGISRQAANQRVGKLKTKLQRLLIENNFAYDLSA